MMGQQNQNHRVGVIFAGERDVLMYSHHLAPTTTY